MQSHVINRIIGLSLPVKAPSQSLIGKMPYAFQNDQLTVKLSLLVSFVPVMKEPIKCIYLYYLMILQQLHVGTYIIPF